MSALVSISSAKPFEPELLGEIISTMQHRSHADANLFAHQFGGICYRGEENFTDEQLIDHVDIVEGCLIAFDGYLFNQEEFVPEGKKLTETLISMYLSEGESFLNDLDGHFALVIYEVESEQIFIARDKFGVKPLYYSFSDFGLVFSSEAGSFLRSKLVEPALNMNAMPEFWNQGYVSGAQTLFKSIFRVLPGHFILARKAEIISQGSFVEDSESVMECSDEAIAVKTLDENISMTLDSIIASDKPMFMPMTGQIEESLTAISLKAKDVDLRTSSLSFGDFASADMRLRALQTQQDVQTDHLEQDFSDVDFWLQIPGMSAILDDLAVDERMLFKLKMIERVPEGADLAIDTIGAEVLFADRYHYLTSPMDLMLKRNQNYKRGYTAGFADLFKNADIPNWRKKEADSTDISKLKSQQKQDLQEKLPALDLNMLDRIYTAYGWQLFAPFLSQRMVNYASSLSDSLLVKDKQGRQILRKSLAEKSTHIDAGRSLQPVIVPIEAWLNDRRPEIAQYLSKHAGMRQVFVVKDLKELFKRNLTAEASRLVFSMLMFACWYDIYIEGQLPTEMLFPEFHQMAQEMSAEVELEQNS